MRAPISRSCRFESPFCLARHDNPRWLTETDRYRYHENWRAKPRSSPPPLLHFARVSTICPATNGKSVYYMMRIRLIWSFYIGVGNKNERINSAYYIPVIFYCYLEVNILFWRKRRKKRESLADLSKLWKLWWTVFLLRFDKPHATRWGGGGGGGGWKQ